MNLGLGYIIGVLDVYLAPRLYKTSAFAGVTGTIRWPVRFTGQVSDKRNPAGKPTGLPLYVKHCSSLDRVGDHSSTEVKCCGNLRHSPPCSAGGKPPQAAGGD